MAKLFLELQSLQGDETKCWRRHSFPCYYWSLSGAQRTALRLELGVCEAVGDCVPEHSMV